MHGAECAVVPAPHVVVGVHEFHVHTCEGGGMGDGNWSIGNDVMARGCILKNSSSHLPSFF